MDRAPYLDLITSEYINKPLFYDCTDKLLEKAQNSNQILDNFWDYFDISSAVGQQLDVIGQYLNFSRDIMQSAGIGKNKLDNTSVDTTSDGITWGRQSDGREVAFGGNVSTEETKMVIGSVELQAGEYVLNGTPSGGGSSTYFLRASVGGTTIAEDYGNGASFTLSTDSTVVVEAVFSVNYPQRQVGSIVSFESVEEVALPSVSTEDNPDYPDDNSSWVGVVIPVRIVFEPMVRRSSETDPTFEPYLQSGVSATDDETYRMLLKARALQNRWDGTWEGLYNIFSSLFPESVLLIEENETMEYTASITKAGMTDKIIDAFQYGYLLPKPMGVRVNYEFVDSKRFVWDTEETGLNAGWDIGYWFR